MDSASRYFAVLAAVSLELGTSVQLLSLFGALRPAPFLIIQVLFAMGAVLWLRRCKAGPAAASSPSEPWTWPAWGCLAVLAGALVLSAARYAPVPSYVGDERHYHASRCLYWIQNQSVFPYETHNDRQTVLGYQAELFFLSPVLLSRNETAGRMIFWLGFPAAAVALFLLARALGATRETSLAAAALYAATPQALLTSNFIKPEHWLTAYTCGAAFWVVRGRAGGWLWAGVFTALAFHTKAYALALAPAAVLIALLGAQRLKSLARYAAGLLAGALLSGALSLAAFNLRLHGSAFGPPELTKVVTVEFQPGVQWTQGLRAVLSLMDPPLMPWPPLRGAAERGGEALLSALHATPVLPGESEQQAWPGIFRFRVTSPPSRYSLAGTLALAVLAAGLFLWRRPGLRRASLCCLLGAVLLAAIVLGMRWMQDSDVPVRFLLTPVALLLASGAGFIAAPLVRRRGFAAALVCAVLLSAYWPVRAFSRSLVHNWRIPMSDLVRDDPFSEVLSVVPPGARILFFGHQNAFDYPLFLSRRGYPNHVFPGGKEEVTPQRLAELFARHRPGFVLFQNGGELAFHWAPSRRLDAAIAWLLSRPDWIEVPLLHPYQRLFRARSTSILNPVSQPENSGEQPILSIDPDLRATVSLGSYLGVPWPAELASPTPMVWIGSGEGLGITVALHAGQALTVRLLVKMEAGPSRRDPKRTLRLRHNGLPAPLRAVVSGTGEAVYQLALQPGRNRLWLSVEETRDVFWQPNGDPRNLMARILSMRLSK
ncbi:MAG: glycosyltransferase family 39 protein [Candidatus Solibacter usitatus]|nr:glycosyltransferase family 39 protein [Candidatus Solibacter usitatus]